MPFHIVEGKRIFYQVEGQGSPLVLIHGSLGNRRLWNQQLPLAEEFQLILIDLPGHGESEPLERLTTIENFTFIIAQILQEQTLDKPTIMGHSLGGAISLQLALDYPNLLGGLILVGTGAKLGVLPTILEGLRTNYQEGIELAFGQLAFASSADPELVSQIKDECLLCPQPVGYADFFACNNFDVRARLHQISFPTLVIVGEEDRLTPLKWSKYLATNIPLAELVQIQSAGHMVMLEQPEKFNKCVRDFLCKINPTI